MLTKKTLLLCFFVLLKMGLQYLLINPGYDLHRDEYLHLDQARHLAWGYESVPPFTSWISWMILQLGNGEFWVKFFPALFGALTLVVVWKATEALKGGIFALILGATAVLCSALLRLNMLYQPNSFDILCWTFLYFTQLKYFQTSANKWLVLAAITFALGFLNKYNIAFCVIGLVAGILLTAERKIFTQRFLYIAATIALLLIAPNLTWQYQHNFPVVHHMKTLAATQLVNVSRSDFLKEQVLFFLGSLFILVAAFIGFLRYPPFKKFRAFGWAFLCTLLIFIYLKAKGYYAIGLYPVYLAFGSVYIEHLINKRRLYYLRPVSIAFIVLSFIPFIKIAFPIYGPADTIKNGELIRKLGLTRWEDGKEHQLPQDYADMLGWRELAHKTDSIFNSIPDKENILVLCDNYGQAGAINYYSTVPDIGAVSMNADYINWFPLATKNIRHVILVKESDDRDPERLDEQALFKSIARVGTIENAYAREKGTAIYLLKDATVSINKLLEKDISEEKNNQ